MAYIGNRTVGVREKGVAVEHKIWNRIYAHCRLKTCKKLPKL